MEKLLNIKYILICLIVVYLSSCKEEQKPVFSINKHSFIEVKKTDSTYIFYKPCDVSILKYKINDNKLIYRTHQDGNYNYKIDTIEYINDSTINIRHRLDKNSPLLNLSIKKKKKYWLIDDKVFIDSIYSKNISYVEQPCIQCFEDCEEEKNNTSDYSNKLNEKELNKWRSKYTAWIDAPEGMDIRLGVRYELNIKIDSVLFSKESFSTEYKYLCKAKQEKDTLYISYYKTISGTEPKNTPTFKMYKTNSNTYIISSQIYDSNRNNNIPILFSKN